MYRYYTTLIVKKFENKYMNISLDAYVDNKQNIWFKGKDVAALLGYKNTDKAIRNHVKGKYKTANISPPPNWAGGPKPIFIQEPGIYSLIFRSKLESAESFQDWGFSEVLPSIRKYGHYRMFNNPNTLAFKIEDEYDLNTKVVQYIRRFYPEILMTAGLGENQDTKDKRIKSFKNLDKHYNFCKFIITFVSITT